MVDTTAQLYTALEDIRKYDYVVIVNRLYARRATARDGKGGYEPHIAMDTAKTGQKVMVAKGGSLFYIQEPDDLRE